MRLGKINFGEEVYTTEEIDQKFAALGADVDARLAEKASLEGGKVPSDELPSYVDDVEEYASLNVFPEEGEDGKIYVAKNTNKTYRWSGTQYIKIGGDDAILTPVYSNTPTFSEWTVEPPTYEGERLVPVFGGISYPIGWSLCKASNLESSILTPLDSDKNATYLHWIDSEILEFTATRTRTDIIGYTLGDQADKPLAPAGEYAKKSDIPAVVAPSTDTSAAGKAADAKATGDALAGKMAATATGRDIQLGRISDAPEGSVTAWFVGAETAIERVKTALTGRLSKAEAEAGFTEWSLEDGATPPGLQLSDQPYIARDGDETYWAVPLVGMGDVRIGGTPADTDATSLSWHGQKEGFEVSFTATRTRLPTMADLNAKQDAISDLATIRAGAADGAAAEETLQFREWFPGGEVKSIDDCTKDLKFDWDNADETNHTVEVLPFCNTGDSTKDNSDKSGRVVIPPYAEKNGVRYAVVGVAEGEEGGLNETLTAIVAPTTVTSIMGFALTGCTSLTSVSLPAATEIGWAAFSYCHGLTSVSFPAATSIVNNAFFDCSSLAIVSISAVTNINDSAFSGCTSLTSINFGPDARQSVPEPNVGTFPDLSQSDHTCSIVVPDDNYDEWTTDPDWAELTSMGYEFVKWSSTQPIPRGDVEGVYAKLTDVPSAEQQDAWSHKVWEYAAFSAFPVTGVENRVYVDKSTNLTYRWDTTSNSYVQIGGSSVTVDDAINAASTNPVRNSAIASALTAYRTLEAQDVIDGAQNTEISKKYTKPASGIPASDLAPGVIPDGQALVFANFDGGGLSFTFNGVHYDDGTSQRIAVGPPGPISFDFDSYRSDSTIFLNGVKIDTTPTSLAAGDCCEVWFTTCLALDTSILMADGTDKTLEKICVGDMLKTPFGPDMVVGVSCGMGEAVDKWLFDDGTEVRTIGRHRFWNDEIGEPVYLEAWKLGEHAIKPDGSRVALVGHDHFEIAYPHKTLVTQNYNLYYANSMLAGNRKSVRNGGSLS